MKLSFFSIFLSALVGMNVVNSNETPKYLYKILSYTNWRATEARNAVRLSGDDDLFIHLSTEEQLGKILEKYWSHTEQYVVLKLDSSQVKGDLRFEANPGGTNRYFHLYNGFIPVQAIVEARIAFNEPIAARPESLEIVQIGHPALRQKARPLTKTEILSPKIQELIEEMKTRAE